LLLFRLFMSRVFLANRDWLALAALLPSLHGNGEAKSTADPRSLVGFRPQSARLEKEVAS
jgi:hypothetical protein